MKKLLTVLIIVVVALFILAIAKDMIIKTAVEKGTEVVTGLPLRIGGFRLGLLSQLVDIKKLVLQRKKFC